MPSTALIRGNLLRATRTGETGVTVRTDRRKTKISDRANIFRFDERVGLDLQNEPQWRVPNRLIQVRRSLATRRMACSISHSMCRSLTAIYANAEFLEHSEVFASVRAEGSAICH